tara:strand:+ start:104 stop:445 length:342 start_codon:yes stop_codon:yes gene_type:complete
MKTIITIHFKNYSDNYIATATTYDQLIAIMKTDKDFLSFEIYQQGTYIFQIENSPIPKKVLTLEKLQEKITYIECSYYSTDAIFRKEQKRKENFEKTYLNKLSKLNNFEQLFL